MHSFALLIVSTWKQTNITIYKALALEKCMNHIMCKHHRCLLKFLLYKTIILLINERIKYNTIQQVLSFRYFIFHFLYVCKQNCSGYYCQQLFVIIKLYRCQVIKSISWFIFILIFFYIKHTLIHLFVTKKISYSVFSL